MGTTRRTGPSSGAATRKGMKTKDRIYTAAIALIHEKGYETVTVPEICHAGGVSVGSFYHHFSSKKDLLAGYVREESDRLFEFYRGLGDRPPLEALFLTLHEFFSYFAVKGQDFVGTFFSIMLSSRGEYFHPADFALYEIIEESLRRAEEEGTLTGSLPLSLLRDLLTGGIWQLMVEWCTAEGEPDLQETADRHLKRFQELLAGAIKGSGSV